MAGDRCDDRVAFDELVEILEGKGISREETVVRLNQFGSRDERVKTLVGEVLREGKGVVTA